MASINFNVYEELSGRAKFYIHEVGKENEKGKLVSVQKNKRSKIIDYDLDDKKYNKKYSIAIYKKEHDTKPYSNIISFNRPQQGIFVFLCVVY